VDIRCERREEAGGDDVPLGDGITGEGGREDRDQRSAEEDREAEGGAAVAPELPQPRTLGSTQATRISASRLPATTSAALTAVAAMTTG
jgi:hypothetical protein